VTDQLVKKDVERSRTDDHLVEKDVTDQLVKKDVERSRIDDLVEKVTDHLVKKDVERSRIDDQVGEKDATDQLVETGDATDLLILRDRAKNPRDRSERLDPESRVLEKTRRNSKCSRDRSTSPSPADKSRNDRKHSRARNLAHLSRKRSRTPSRSKRSRTTSKERIYALFEENRVKDELDLAQQQRDEREKPQCKLKGKREN
jgi:hypothetical protein